MLKRIVYSVIGSPSDRELKRIQPLVDDINELEPTFDGKNAGDLQSLTQQFRRRIKDETADLREQLAEAEEEYDEVAGTDQQKFARIEVDRLRKAILQTEDDILDDILPEAFAAVREAAKRTLSMRHYDVQLLGGIVLHSGKIAEMKTGEGKTLVATLPIYLNALSGRGVHLVTPNDYLSKVGLQLMGPVYRMLGLTASVIQSSAGDPDKGSFLFDPEFPAQDDRFKSLRPISRREAYHADITYGTNNEFGFDYLRDNMVMDPERMTQRPLHFAIVDEVDNILVDEARTPLIISGEAQASSDNYSKFSGLVRTLRKDEHYEVNEKERVATLTEDGIAAIEEKLGLENLYNPEHFEMIPYLDNALRARALYTRDKDYIVRGDQVIIVDEFTGRLMEGRRYGEGLHQAIEAKEGVKIKKESMTLATITFQNYFRMYDKLAGMTGTAKTEEEEFQSIYNLDVIEVPTYKPIIRDDQADVVYKSQQSKFKAVLDAVQEAHERGAPVLLGTVAIETSEMLSKALSRKGIPHEVLNAKNHEREATIIAQAGRPGALTIATNMAGRGVDILLGGNPEGLAREQMRKEGVDLTELPQREWNEVVDKLSHNQPVGDEYSDRWVDLLKESFEKTRADKEAVLELGGLHVLGTERHEARRIDNQLRGRAGRLGDPGVSQFFLSLDDELIRRFGGDRITGIMDRLGIEDDQPIEAGMISKAIENAQSKVEGHNFDIRKHVLRYDEVVNEQRETIYSQRQRILVEPSVRLTILDMISEEIERVVRQFTNSRFQEEWNLEEMIQSLRSVFPFPEDFTPEDWANLDSDEILEQAEAMAMAVYEEKAEKLGETTMREVERQIMLRAVDHRWVRHLTDLDRLREGIGLQAIAQVDPLVAYKRQAYSMYLELMGDIRSDVVQNIMSLSIQERPRVPQPIARNIQARRGSDVGQQPKQQTVRNTNERPGRNDDCWCGSGKKYKHCHMKADIKSDRQPEPVKSA